MLSTRLDLNVHSVSSVGINWGSNEDFRKRIEHEDAGVTEIKKNQENIKTMAAFQAFLMFGGHRGIRKYLFNDYVKSQGGGW